MIDVCCPHCGEKYHAAEEHIGRSIRCTNPSCRRFFTLKKPEIWPVNDPPNAVPRHEDPKEQHRTETGRPNLRLRFTQRNIFLGAAACAVIAFVVGLSYYSVKQIFPLRVPDTQSQNKHKPVSTHSPDPQAAIQIPVERKKPVSPSVSGVFPNKTKPLTKVIVPKHVESLESSDAKARSPEPHQHEIEPLNPNVLPLGTAPFDYDVRGGNSTLKVDNGTDTDAIVRVTQVTGENIRNFFIPAGKKFTAESIPPADYVLRIGFGRDWNTQERRFNFRRSFSRTEVFKVTESKWEEETEDGYIVHTKSTDMSITLHKVVGGNFKSYPISEEEFWK